MENTHVHISHSISRKKSGTLVFTSDFTGLGTEAAIRKSLSRLVHQGLLRRLAYGIYYIPKVDTVLGEVRPAAEDVAALIARNEKIHIWPTKG